MKRKRKTVKIGREWLKSSIEEAISNTSSILTEEIMADVKAWVIDEVFFTLAPEKDGVWVEASFDLGDERARISLKELMSDNAELIMDNGKNAALRFADELEQIAREWREEIERNYPEEKGAEGR